MGKKYKKVKLKKYRKNSNRSVISKFYKNIQYKWVDPNTPNTLEENIETKILALKKKIKHNIIIMLLLGILLLLLTGIIIFFLNYPYIEIIGDQEIIIKYKTDYIDNGVKGVKFFKDISQDIKIDNQVNSNIIGQYEVIYSYKYLNFNIKKKRTIKVIDDTPPIITLKGEQIVKLCPLKKYEEEGFKAVDDYDGDISNKVIIDSDQENIFYYVADSSGNTASLTRKIIKEDTEKPTINLSGPKTKYIYKGNKYIENGYTAHDNCDGNITSQVKVNNMVDINSVGQYKIEYKVNDSSGNTTIETRKIYVIEKKQETTTEAGVIYLTFDDGPSNSITPKILDILKKEEVKATFFVIGSCNNFEKLVSREFKEGHTIALHSYSHNYEYVYKSVNDYFKDLDQIRDKVYKVTGEYSNIIRFPGGSSNTISRHYKEGIMTTLVTDVKNKGYHYFDWNISSSDAGGVSSSNEVYNKVINNLSHNRSNVILMHDFENNYYTLNALEDIINYGKSNGYVFKKITMNTPEVHHKVAN